MIMTKESRESCALLCESRRGNRSCGLWCDWNEVRQCGISKAETCYSAPFLLHVIMCGMWGNVKAVTFIVVAVSTVCGLQMRFQAASYAGCISHHEARKILSHKTAALQAPVLKTLSVDLGCTEQPIVLNKDGLHSCGEKMLASWDEIDEIMKKTAGCYALYDDGSKPWQISAMSEKTHFSASLCPPLTRAGAPTMVLGGFTMHRIAGDNVDPMTDTVNKIGAIKPFITPHSRILDTCMGLGYTATSAARLLSGTGRLTTIEYDDVSVEMCKYNPWSKGLFDESLPIDTHMVSICAHLIVLIYIALNNSILTQHTGRQLRDRHHIPRPEL